MSTDKKRSRPEGTDELSDGQPPMKVSKVHSFDLNRLSQAVASGQNNIRIQDFTNYDKLENVVIEQFEVGSELLSQLTKYFFIVPGSALAWAKKSLVPDSPDPHALIALTRATRKRTVDGLKVDLPVFVFIKWWESVDIIKAEKIIRNNDKRNQVIETSIAAASNFEDF